MDNIIHLLPDHIANQIAAGEVIQRPASAVKELLENAVDAGATSIKLLVNDAGKALIQVIDNGKGMSAEDAKMAFERHATSKISQIEDLFRIKTMGFRGEALASIAAVAQVELKTRRAIDELGSLVAVEHSKIIQQEACVAPVGTSISMKNLFFNVPARRNFLKSNAAEMRHIMDEFIRVAMAYPEIFFSLNSNGQEVYHLEAGTRKQRIVQILGNSYNAKLVNVLEETDYMTISGFVGKPETARKTRGDQYFFVNNRFIKSAYLNHAVNAAFEGMISKDSFPSYVLYIALDPTQIDINVHPTKQEIKFEDEKIIYAFVQAAVKHALAQFSIAPSLDFSLNADIQGLDAVSKPFTSHQQEAAVSSSLYKTFSQKHQAHFIEPTPKSELKSWKDFLNHQPIQVERLLDYQTQIHLKNSTLEVGFYRYRRCNIIYKYNNHILLQLRQLVFYWCINNWHTNAFLYEQYSQAVHNKQAPTQKSLFPIPLELAESDKILLEELLPDLHLIGYQIEQDAQHQYVIQGTPADIATGNEKHAIEMLIEQFKHFNSDVNFSRKEKLIRCMAKQQSTKTGTPLDLKEMAALVNALFECNTPNISPTGSPTYIEYKGNYLEQLFKR